MLRPGGAAQMSDLLFRPALGGPPERPGACELSEHPRASESVREQPRAAEHPSIREHLATRVSGARACGPAGPPVRPRRRPQLRAALVCDMGARDWAARAGPQLARQR